MTPAAFGDRRPALVALGAAVVAALAGLAWLPGARATPFPALLWWGAAWVAYVAAWARIARHTTGAGAGPTRTIVWTVGIVARLALLAALPHFSDDLYRYLWDGRVLSHGINPYLHAPDAAALEPLRTGWHGLVNHPSIRTIYPPGAQGVFAVLAAVGGGVLLYKAAWVTADLGVAWCLDRLDRRRGRDDGGALLLWLWSPLVLVEVAWSGHMEPLGVLAMTAAVWGLARSWGGERAHDRGPSSGGDRPDVDPGRGSGAGAAAGALLGLGASVKFAPVVALPALWRRHGLRAAAALLLVPVLLYLPVLDAGAALFDGLTEYAARWEFNAGPYEAVAWLLGAPAARWAGPAAAAAVAARAGLRRWSVERTLFWGIGVALVLSPTVHPWYVLWVLPFAALRRNRAWILFTGLVFLAYAGLDAFHATGRWPQPAWLALLIHVPFLVLLALDAGRDRILHGRTSRPGRRR